MGLFFFSELSMQIFVKALSGTHTLQVENNECVEQLRQRIQVLEGIPSEQQRLTVATSTLVDGRTLSEFGVEDLSVVELSLTLEGGRKKQKKEKLAVLKYYKVDPRTHKIERLKRECTHPDCGPGVFMANHFNRQYCGKCHLTYMGINKDEQ